MEGCLATDRWPPRLRGVSLTRAVVWGLDHRNDVWVTPADHTKRWVGVWLACPNPSPRPHPRTHRLCATVGVASEPSSVPKLDAAPGYYLNKPISKKKPTAIIAVAATPSPGHKCHSFIIFTHDLPAISGLLCGGLRALKNEEREGYQQCQTENHHEQPGINEIRAT